MVEAANCTLAIACFLLQLFIFLLHCFNFTSTLPTKGTLISAECCLFKSKPTSFFTVFSSSALAQPPCQSNPCRNGGVCQSQGEGFMCTCLNGFTGVFCETREYRTAWMFWADSPKTRATALFAYSAIHETASSLVTGRFHKGCQKEWPPEAVPAFMASQIFRNYISQMTEFRELGGQWFHESCCKLPFSWFPAVP